MELEDICVLLKHIKTIKSFHIFCCCFNEHIVTWNSGLGFIFI